MCGRSLDVVSKIDACADAAPALAAAHEPGAALANSLCGPGLGRRLSAVRNLVGVGGVVAALSVTSDLTRGHPPGEAMRACLLATELARRAGLDLVRQG
jgi:hypothetical protein